MEPSQRADHPVRLLPQVKDVNLCLFEDSVDRDKVLRGGAWSINGSHIIMPVEKWPPIIPPENVSFNHINFWVQAKGLPPSVKLPQKSSCSSL